MVVEPGPTESSTETPPAKTDAVKDCLKLAFVLNYSNENSQRGFRTFVLLFSNKRNILSISKCERVTLAASVLHHNSSDRAQKPFLKPPTRIH